ncbi:MAG: hypothetical protein LIO42_03780 [Oscillospiraceae bacterium]|nr:hypothetical protein [Oscillospiraceae bacterium]
MKGSEKQLEWAKDIIAKLETALEEAKADPRMAELPEAQREDLIRRTAELIQIISEADYAGDVIEVGARAARKNGQDAIGYLGSSIRLTVNPLAKKLRETIQAGNEKGRTP